MEHGKQDKRMTGWADFTHAATFNSNVDLQKFCDIRDWCYEIWGVSCEYEYWRGRPAPNQFWSWANDLFKCKIYFRTEKEYTLFLLRWV